VQTVVATSSGQVRGRVERGEQRDVAAFLGIPYAVPPYGEHRFGAPASPRSWAGVREAVEFGATAPAPPVRPPLNELIRNLVIPGEDCLTVNVWTPNPSPAAALPVLVWIHGGAFTIGSSALPSYAGTPFARDGVVFVSLNYRLGVDGYAWFGDGGPENRALLDQLAALRWVQSNIAAFGGDPARVTVMGESAGAFSVACLLACPASAGLFRRAVLESGAGHLAVPPEDARRITVAVADRLGVHATRTDLGAVPVEKLIAAQAEVAADVQTHPDPARWGENARIGLPLAPVIDSELLTARPIDRIAAGFGADVEVLIGTNSDEHRLFLVPAGAADGVDARTLAGAAALYGLPPEALDTYRARRPGTGPAELFMDLMTDWYWWIPALRMAEARRDARGATFVYEFTWTSPWRGGRLGACHAAELGFVFDLLDCPDWRPLLGDGPPQALADRMHRAWVDFVTTGNPGWPRYDMPDRCTMRFGDASTVERDPGATRRALWDGLR